MKGTRSKGLSLIEIIMSVAVLGFLSVFILQMFLTAQRLNDDAQVLDISVLNATTAIEHMKSEGSFDALLAYEFFDEAEKVDANSLSLYYDANWIKVKDYSNYKYRLYAVKKPDSQLQGFMNNSVEVFVNNKDGEKVLYELNMLQGIAP